MRRQDIDAAEVVRLYVEEGWRGPAIATHLGCNVAAVYARLAEAGVATSRRANLDPAEVKRQYVVEELTLSEVARRNGVAPGTIRRWLGLWGVPLRGRLQQVSGRHRCPPSETFRAYLLGLVWGDFVAEKASPRSRVIAVRSSTTHQAQIDLARRVFEPFGPLYVWTGPRSSSMRASLDLSFEFLLEKYGQVVPTWVRGTGPEAAFAAGYVDAEGSFGIYEGRGRFKLDSYDRAVLEWFADWAGRIGVTAILRMVVARTTDPAAPVRRRHDLWRVNVNAGDSLLRLAATLEPFVRHATRRATMAAVVENVQQRLRARDPAGTHPIDQHHQPR